jgi:hypothetical protein
MCSHCTGEYEGRAHGLPTHGSHDYSTLWRPRSGANVWRERPTQIELLAQPKYAISDDLEALQQLLAAAYSVYLIHLEVKR